VTSLDDVASCSASGANKLACAYCQASPAALVLAPSSGAPLSSLDHPIWSRTDGDINFRVHVCFFFSLALSMLFDIDLYGDRFVLVCKAKCEQKYLG